MSALSREYPEMLDHSGEALGDMLTERADNREER